MKNNLLKHNTLRRAENPSPREEYNYQPDNFALVHEVRNPLTNINLAVGMLRSITNIDNPEVYLDIISRASSKIEALLNSLLTPSGIGINQSGNHSIHKLLDEVLAATCDRIDLKHIIIKKEYALQDCEIALNEQEMKIALSNLIVNAIEAITNEGGILKILTRSKKEKFIIRIEDNGCGISKKDLKNIFKPYFTNKPKGVGLGLVATSYILRSNHAAIKVKSVVKKGTCFEISLDKNYSLSQEHIHDEPYRIESRNPFRFGVNGSACIDEYQLI